jgi:hypothetical protein
MAIDLKDFMTGYEARILKGKRKTSADLLKDEKMVATAVKDILGSEVTRVTNLETGEAVDLPLVYDLVIDLFKYWKENPSKIDLKVMSAVLGETKVEVAANDGTAGDFFAGIAIRKPKKGEGEGE